MEVFLFLISVLLFLGDECHEKFLSVSCISQKLPDFFWSLFIQINPRDKTDRLPHP